MTEAYLYWSDRFRIFVNRLFTLRRFYVCLFLVMLAISAGGCAWSQKRGDAPEIKPQNTSESKSVDKSRKQDIGKVKVSKFLLSPGDEIEIQVYQHDELGLKLTIPPDGVFFYPIVGEINTKGKSLRDLRKIITDGLSMPRKSYLLPGDEINITVYRNDELNRKLIIPPDEFIFFPIVGEINTKGKSLRDLREIITKGLVSQIRSPQVSVDITKLESQKRIPDPQVSVSVVSYSGQKVFVLGEVKNPGVFLTDGQVRIIDVISQAGGVTLDGRSENVLLIRGGLNSPELITVDLKKIFKEGDIAQNVRLQRGDIIYVPRTTISNVDRFFTHLSTIISPLLNLESGYFIGQQIERGSGTATVPAN